MTFTYTFEGNLMIINWGEPERTPHKWYSIMYDTAITFCTYTYSNNITTTINLHLYDAILKP